MSVSVGLEHCLESPPSILAGGARFGLLVNQASVDRRLRYAHDLLSKEFPGQLAAIFSPQHGLFGTEQDNMVETPHGSFRGIPVYSLYSETRWPTAAMLDGLDCLVVDLQDVGTRVYTYAWTLSHCLEECGELGIPVVVLDRPNPLGGELVEGARLDEEFRSFVGRAPVPMRHALTLGEFAGYLNQYFDARADLVIVPAKGWRRDHDFFDLQHPWVPPSPNLPRGEGALVYPGAVLFEGTNLSEGRGTTTPFEIVGAPFVEPLRLVAALEESGLDGVTFRPVWFTPTFQKWKDESCGGVFIHPLNPGEFRPYRAALVILDAIRRLWPEEFQWGYPPYEYEVEKMPIDILSGSSEVREAIDAGCSTDDFDRLAGVDEEAWWSELEPFLLYPP